MYRDFVRRILQILRKDCEFFGTFFRLSREIIRQFFVGIIVSNFTALKALFQPESTPFLINADNELFANSIKETHWKN